MRRLRYILRSLAYYRGANLAVLCGASVATAALTGALLIGRSVQDSLRRLTLTRLGETRYLLASQGYFRDALSAALEPGWKACPILTLDTQAEHESSGRRSTQVDLFGVDDRFYRFHNSTAAAPSGRDAWLSPALAAEFGAKPGDTVLLRVELPSSIPREFLFGHKDDTSRVLRLRVAGSVTPPSVADFALRQRQGDVNAVFVSLDFLRTGLKIGESANALLIAGPGPVEDVASRIRQRFSLEDAGLRLKSLDSDHTVLEHESTVLDDRTASSAIEAGRRNRILTRPFSTWLANEVVHGPRTSPYALVAAADETTLAELNGDEPLPHTERPAVLLNPWFAADLNAQPGQRIRMDYYVWKDSGELTTESAEFDVAGIIRFTGLAADRHIAPEYPGITDSASISSWDPPFPIDLKKVRPRDEEYWKLYRATPKAWVSLDTARKLWSTRFGTINSIRFSAPASSVLPLVRPAVDPFASQLAVIPVRSQALESSSGSTDFGEYFLYFSFLLVVSALLLMGLFFRLSIEQRASEISLLRAIGFDAHDLRILFLGEGLILAVAGSVAGGFAGIGWAWLLLEGLRRWWIGAVGTRLLTLSVSKALVAAGILAGVAVAAVAIWLTLRRYQVLLPRAAARPNPSANLRLWWACLFGSSLLALASLAASASGAIPVAGGFFAAGLLLLLAALSFTAISLGVRPVQLPSQPGSAALWRLAARNAAWRPGRSLLCVALVSLAVFLLVSLEAFRQHERSVSGLWAESLSPIVNDPNSQSGRVALNLDSLPPARWTLFRLRPGDDVSCLNLYRPADPRILGVPESWSRSNPLGIVSSTAASPQTEANPWLLLESQLEEGVIPAIVDQNSMTYVLHKRLGDTVEILREGAEPIRLRLVGATAAGLFQSEILISEKSFVRLFPGIAGWRVFLIDAPPAQIAPLEEALASYGFDAKTAAERLAGFHRVENTYISTFQSLGGLALLIGIAGLAAVLLRNTLERRRELGLLGAVGFDSTHLQRVVLFENILLIVAGLVIGAITACLAVAPALAARGAALPIFAILGLLALVLAAGCVASWLSVRAVAPEKLVAALRTG